MSWIQKLILAFILIITKVYNPDAQTGLINLFDDYKMFTSGMKRLVLELFSTKNETDDHSLYLRYKDSFLLIFTNVYVWHKDSF